MDPLLYKAASSGDITFFRKFQSIMINPLLIQVTPQGNTVLHVAAKFKQKQIIEIIINLCPSLLYRTNVKGDTPLHIASRLGSSDIVQLLINPSIVEVEEGLDLVWMVNKEKDTALHDAVRHGHFEVIKILIRAEPGLALSINGAGESPLFLAVDRKLFHIAHHILQAVPECSYGGRNGMNVLHAAVIRTHVGYHFQYLIDIFKQNPRIRASLIYQRLPSLLRASIGFTQAAGIHVFTKDAFMYEAMRKCSSAIRDIDDFGWTPLHYAAHLGHEKAVKQILETCSSLAYVKGKEGMPALHVAAKEGHVNVMRRFINICPDTCELLDNRGHTVFHVAAKSGKANAVKYFLKTPDFEGLINERDQEGNTPLHLAAFQGHDQIVVLLANDRRVHKGATNREGLAAVDIIQSNSELRHCRKFWITMKLIITGGLPTLGQVANREGTKAETIGRKGGGQVTQTVTKESADQDEGGLGTGVDEKGKGPEENEVMIKHALPKRKAELAGRLTFHRLKDIANTNILVATIIATVTFAAGFQMPGGYHQDGVDQGTAILSKKSSFVAFMIADTVAFCCSTASMFLHFWASLEDNHRILEYNIYSARLLSECAIIGMEVAFISGTNVVLAGSPWLNAAALSIGCWFFVSQFVLLFR